ncbi:hypothetical protein BDF20DRAFT_716749 [Mycotypha africana]|uniref:uncharacterized protein n=1 Tax=Mycotypha africana TaxID=64632 RepID=UPI0022FFFE48|nr:uncharacterized protein BDF20DRAFT_716749 [Mycotypha africana]KAI8972043.1 hypothetical protein BDF20DRAFT_716749 [Mycotypha africana]
MPKEKRNRRLIIKSFLVKAHKNRQLCPIATFKSLVAKCPATTSTKLFLTSSQFTSPLRCRPSNAGCPRYYNSRLSPIVKQILYHLQDTF